MTIDLFNDISGENISLIKLDIEHLNDMWEYSANPKFYEHFEFGPHKEIKDTEEYLKKLIKRSNGVNAFWWFVKINKTKKVIGSFGIHDIDFNRKSCEISYGLSPKFWGKGIFMEILNLVLKNLFIKYDFYRITAMTSSKNIRSIQALKKAGFIKEGQFRDFYCLDNGTRFDATLMSLIKTDYLKIYN